MPRGRASNPPPRARVSWGDYIANPRAQARYSKCLRRCGPAFSRQRDLVRRVCEERRPKSVACLGAGVLNDIPYRALVRSGAHIHLVDWLPGAIDAGLAAATIGEDDAGQLFCAYCQLGDDDARAYCRQYRRSTKADATVCDHFTLARNQPGACSSYKRGSRPAVYQEDVTAGYASAFGKEVEKKLPAAQSWTQALKAAAAAACRVTRHRDSLSIPDASIDLATSSMVVSQFEHEPYGYFSSQTAALLGPPAARDERRLRPALERLRTTLLEEQMDRHCDEITRILAPGGACFMSFELFHRDDEAGTWFLVREMHAALARIAKRFRFDHDLIGESDMILRFEAQTGPSLVLSMLLEPVAGKNAG